MAFKNIGALWLKDGNNGKFMSGSIEINGEKYKIMVFKNNRKGLEKHPDYQIVQADDSPHSPVSPPASQPQQFTPPVPPPPTAEPMDEIRIDDIPF